MRSIQSHYYAFGSPMAGRTHSQENYRFGFNGKENDNETYGTGNALDFGARIYDSRLGRWLSVDPLIYKYPNFSPYQAFKNSPILYIDIDGRDNIIYLIILPSAQTKLSKEDRLQIQYKANVILKLMGVNTRVKLFDGTDFDPKYIDKNDSYALIGNKTEISNFVSNPQDNSKPKSEVFSRLHLRIQGDEFLIGNAPETSVGGEIPSTYFNGEKREGEVGQGIAIDVAQVNNMFCIDMGLKGELPFSIGFIVVHGITHNAGVGIGGHIGDINNISMNSSGGVISAYVNGDNGKAYRGDKSWIRGSVPRPIQNFISAKNAQQKEIVNSINSTFGKNKPKDNYEKNRN